jgi:uncharacterized membrane protein YccC
MAELQAPPKLVGITAFPGTAVAIRRAKAWGGIAGFAAAFLASHFHGATTASALERGVAGGVIGFVVVWAVAVTAWRYVLTGVARRAVRRSGIRLTGK